MLLLMAPLYCNGTPTIQNNNDLYKQQCKRIINVAQINPVGWVALANPNSIESKCYRVIKQAQAAKAHDVK